MNMLNYKNLQYFILIISGFLLVSCSSQIPQELGNEGFVKGFMGGIVADEPKAALEGKKVLSAGGSAADAATAAYFTLAVTLPSKASLGGGGVCIVYDPKTNKTESLDFLNRLPSDIPATRSRPSAVPGNPLGIFALHARYGRFQWSSLVSVGEKLARYGIQAPRTLIRDIRQVKGALLEDRGSRAIFLKKNGNIINEGDYLRQIDLAVSLSNIRQFGPGDFYNGRLAKRLVDSVKDASGTLEAGDLKKFRPVWRDTLALKFGLNEINFVQPPAYGGVTAAQVFQILNNNRLFKDATEQEQIHILAEAVRRVNLDKQRWLSDDFALIGNLRDLISRKHAIRLMKNFQKDKYAELDPRLARTSNRSENPSATGLVVVDREGLTVTCSFTMNNIFGNGRIARGTGIMLAAAPINIGKGPSALGPIIVRNKNSKNLFFAGAASGGAPSTTALMQVLTEVMINRKTLRDAIHMPRVHHGGMPSITFHEPALNKVIQKYLSNAGHKMLKIPSLGQVNAIYCPGGLPRDDVCQFVTDPRGSGLATGATK
ncbi:MAG: gamma-glutamyltransferase [Rhodospirillales bacterium]|nr:gamma-glutamyltransferase [Rhodospirillales bacterium]